MTHLLYADKGYQYERRNNYKIERFDLGKYFEAILIEGEIGFGKPDARMYRLALSALELKPEETWMVGDNLNWDVEAPQQMGIRAIWIDRKGTGVPVGSTLTPHRVIRDISEVLSIISIDRPRVFLGL